MLGVAILAQLAIAANGPDTATACLPLRVSAAFRTPGRSCAGHRAAAGSGLQLLRSRVSSRVESDGAAQFSTITEAWADVAISPVGRIQLPPFVAVVDGKRISSNPIVVSVREPISPPPIVLVDARLDDAHGVESRDSLFVGQQVDYRVDVLLNETARTRLRRNPTFFPPEMSAVLAYDVDIPRGMPKQGRRCFETLSYRRGLFPLFPGNVTIPPARAHLLPAAHILVLLARGELRALAPTACASSRSIRRLAIGPRTTPARWVRCASPRAPRRARRGSAIPWSSWCASRRPAT